jgi:anti-sigma factor RsiW
MRKRRGITCREMVELMTDYLEGAMPRRLRGRFEQHLARCDGCTNALEQLRETVRITGTLTEEQIPEEHRARLLVAFRDWRQGG